MPLTLIGAPTDVGASVLGASMGPDALRIAGISRALQGLGLEVQDLGNLSGPGNPQAPPSGGFRHLAEVTSWNQAVFAATLATLEAGRLPLLMGGDHCLAIGSISAVARHCRTRGKRLKMLWFDAHADANTPATSPSARSACASPAMRSASGPRLAPSTLAPTSVGAPISDTVFESGAFSVMAQAFCGQ